jgi:hypothetical protein
MSEDACPVFAHSTPYLALTRLGALDIVVLLHGALDEMVETEKGIR